MIFCVESRLLGKAVGRFEAGLNRRRRLTSWWDGQYWKISGFTRELWEKDEKCLPTGDKYANI